MTSRPKPFEKGTAQKDGDRQKHHLHLSYTHTVCTYHSYERIYILYYSRLAIEPQIYIIYADSMDYTSTLAVRVMIRYIIQAYGQRSIL